MKKDLGSKRTKSGGLCRRAQVTSSTGQLAGRASPLDRELHESRHSQQWFLEWGA